MNREQLSKKDSEFENQIRPRKFEDFSGQERNIETN